MESASTHEIKVIMESPMPLTPTRCLVKEQKIALVARSMLLFVVYAESRLPSLTSFYITLVIRSFKVLEAS